MSVYENFMSQLSDKGALFNVRSEKLQTASGLLIPNKKVIINERSNDPIGIVSEGYKVVKNEEIFDGFCKSIEKSNINTDGAQINVSFAKGGAKTLVDFIFPEESFSVDGDSSKTALNIVALNSFDGSTRYITKAGGFRIKCMNGQVIGNIASAYSSTHTNKLDVDAGAQRVINMLQEFQGAKHYWGKMLQTPLTHVQAHKIIEEFIGKKVDFSERIPAMYDCVNRLWLAYAKEFGQNTYALYNAMTDYVSHKESKTGCVKRISLEKRIVNTMPMLLGV